MKNGSSNKIFGHPAQAARFLLRYVLNKLIEVLIERGKNCLLRLNS
jgi:hypothetical protein